MLGDLLLWVSERIRLEERAILDFVRGLDQTRLRSTLWMSVKESSGYASAARRVGDRFDNAWTSSDLRG